MMIERAQSSERGRFDLTETDVFADSLFSLNVFTHAYDLMNLAHAHHHVDRDAHHFAELRLIYWVVITTLVHLRPLKVDCERDRRLYLHQLLDDLGMKGDVTIAPELLCRENPT